MIIFNKEASSTYDNWYNSSLGKLVDRVEKDLVVDMADLKKGEDVLELGCGTGNYSLYLAERGVNLKAVDISPFMLDKAREKSKERELDINFIEADIMHLPFTDNTFDLVLSVTAFEFIEEAEKSAREAWRVVKPGGRLIIAVIADNSPWTTLYEKTAKNKDSVFRYGHFYSPEELLALLSEAKGKYEMGLYFGPDFPAEQSEKALELELKGRKEKKRNGGFICARWDK
jgi:ubiquinone/menaquinone biosynthesis C-methylase UbiE